MAEIIHAKGTQMPIGTANFFHNDKRYGLLPDNGGDAFVDVIAAETGWLPGLNDVRCLSHGVEAVPDARTAAVRLGAA